MGYGLLRRMFLNWAIMGGPAWSWRASTPLRARLASSSSTTSMVIPSPVGQARRLPYARVSRRNFKPFTAISFLVGSMRRQMAAARAITFTSVVKDSMTTSPL